VTTRQTFAISNPLLDPTDTDALQKFAKTILRDSSGFGTILTVDHFNDITCWHVSVTALSPHSRPIAWKDLKPSEREAVYQVADELLENVGRPDSDVDSTEMDSYQILRKLTIEEERLLKRSR
jgi:hypothetical protein